MEMLLLHNQCDSSISCTAVSLLVQWCQNKPANNLVTDFEFFKNRWLRFNTAKRLRTRVLHDLCDAPPQAGEFLLVALAFALPAWNHLLLAGACVNTACLLAYPLVTESARWLLSRGRLAEATIILQETARANKTSMPAQLLAHNSFCMLPAATAIVTDGGGCQLPPPGLVSVYSQDAAMEEGGVPTSKPLAEAPLGVWQRQLAFRMLVLLLNWFALYLCYYGITVSSGGIQGSV